MSDKTGWFTHAQLADMVAVSESTPGAMGVNMATYVGFETAGIPGAMIATLGLICPSVIIILLIARALKQFRQNPTVDAVFYALRPCSVALIAAAGVLVAKITFLEGSSVRLPELILAAVLLVLTRGVKPLKKLHPVVFIAGSALIGIIFAF